MAWLYDRLVDADQPTRRAVAGKLIHDLRFPTARSLTNEDIERLCHDVTRSLGLPPGQQSVDFQTGHFSLSASAALLKNRARISGFLNAIARTSNVHTAIDAGCGSAAVLALGVAVTHPDAYVYTYEVDGPAARCAREVVRLLGFETQIDVMQADVLATPLPPVDLAVTETFYPGLMNEQGHLITPILAKRATEILPTSLVMYAADTSAPVPGRVWQRSAAIDLRTPPNVLVGHLKSTGSGRRPLSAYSGFYDARGEAVLDVPDRDTLTGVFRIGSIVVAHADVAISYSYSLDPHVQPKEFQRWVE